MLDHATDMTSPQHVENLKIINVTNVRPIVVLTDSLKSNDLRELLKTSFLDKCSNSGVKNPRFIFLGKGSLSQVSTDSSLCQNSVYWAIKQARSVKILPSLRSLILPVNNQQRAIQLCIAKLTKQKCGEFVASASDVLDVWKLLNLTDDKFTVYNDDNQIKEAVHSYREFLMSSASLDHFDLIKLLKKNFSESDSRILKSLQETVVVIEELGSLSQIELEILKIILGEGRLFKAVSTTVLNNSAKSYEDSVLNISGIDFNNTCIEGEIPEDFTEPSNKDPVPFQRNLMTMSEPNETTKCPFKFSPEQGSFQKFVDDNLQSYQFVGEPSGHCLSKQSERYVEQLFLAHIRLLINTRDEIALAIILSMPGRDISSKDFTKIKAVAQKKNMPIYQTIMSTILRLQLGGKGYQPEKSCPIVIHAKQLTEFVELMNKLQNITEEEREGRKAFERILSQIKCTLLRIKGCRIPYRSIEVVHKNLMFLSHHPDDNFDEFEDSQDAVTSSIACQTLTVNKSLQPALRFLIKLCDYAAGCDMDFLVSDIIGEQILTQKTPVSQGKKQSPFRVPSILSLFSSPSPTADKKLSPCSKEIGDSTPLRVRMLRKDKQLARKNTNDNPRFQSCCAWASDNLSPINKGSWPSPNELSPITGSTLNSVAPRTKSSIDWETVFDRTSVEKDDEQSSFKKKKVDENPPSDKSGKAKSKSEAIEKKQRKRSLLFDISNLKDEPERKKTKSKKETDNQAISLKSSKSSKKLKPLLCGQLAITSFFRKS